VEHLNFSKTKGKRLLAKVDYLFYYTSVLDK